MLKVIITLADYLKQIIINILLSKKMFRIYSFIFLCVISSITPIGQTSLAGDHSDFAIEILTDTTNPVNRQFYDLISNNNHKHLKVFLDDGANPNITDNSGVSPIHYAAYFGNVEALQILIQNGANVTARTIGGWSPLHYAAIGGHTDIAIILLTKSTSVDQKDDGGEIPLFYAIEKAKLPMVKLLVKHGANVNETNDVRVTPMDIATVLGHRQIVEYLSSQGAKQGKGFPPQ